MKWAIYLCWICFLIGCGQNETPPYAIEGEISEPIIFSGNEIETTNGINFSTKGDRLYISNLVDKKFSNDRSYAGIFLIRFENGNWTAPERLMFEVDIDAYHPVLSIDNQLLFFNSRSHPDSGNISIKHNIWVAKRRGDSWADLQMVEGVNSPDYDSYPSVAKNNNLYFNSDRAGGLGGMDIYLSRFVDGEYQTPVNIQPLNSADEENDLVVDPQERWIIFNRYFHSTQKTGSPYFIQQRRWVDHS